MLYGSYQRILDEKARLTIPSKLRNDLSNKLFVVKGTEGSLNVFAEDAFNAYLERLELLPDNEKNTRDVLRVALSSVVELELDAKSRVQLPVSLIEKYHLETNLVVVGMIDHLEIWNESLWNEYIAENEIKYEEKLEKLLGDK